MTEDYRMVMLPTIDVISNDTFAYVRRSFEKGCASRGIFNLKFQYKSLKSITHLVNPSKPFETPVMPGNAFAITKTFFWELGAYDAGLDGYGKCKH